MNKDYTVYCINCGSHQHLRMMPHRNVEAKMVGWIFVCPDCESYIADKILQLIRPSTGGRECMGGGISSEKPPNKEER